MFMILAEQVPQTPNNIEHKNGGRGSGRLLRQYYLKIGIIQPSRCKSAK